MSATDTLANRAADLPAFVPDRMRITPAVTPDWHYIELFDPAGECYALCCLFLGGFNNGPETFSDVVKHSTLYPSLWQRGEWTHS
jgi:hypothetical protein